MAYTDAQRARRRPTEGTLFKLVDEYRKSSEFTTLAQKTQRDYERYLRLIEDEFGTMPVSVVEHPKSRGEFKAWRDSFAAKPRKADYAWTTLARVLSVAKDNGRIAVNVCERGGRLYESERAEKIWSAEDITAFCAAASEELQFALLLALWTGQRQGDLLALTWSAYDGKTIRLRQGKTRKRVTIPVGEPLRVSLDAIDRGKRASTHILVNSRHGHPWTESGFRSSWNKAHESAGLGDLHFHDLRGTAVTRLALSGCTVPEIASITGHSLKDVEAILDAHYLGGRLELAEIAIAKLGARYATGT
ncbi:MAG: tyrosine-type recombinase/integrase [Chelatococcus sp.]|nr:tyrosine-type recombinase/integrase [Chelatococcus sp.]